MKLKMTLNTVQKRLHRLGVDIPKNTLKRWAYDGLIPRPERYKKGKGKGMGRAVSWDREAILDAASLWAVKDVSGHKLMPSKKRIDVIKHAVGHVYESPFAIYDNPPRKFQSAVGQSVSVKYINEGFPGLLLFPGKTLPDRSDALNSMVVAWICAREKARRGMPIREPRRVVMHWKTADVFEKTTIDASDHDEVIHN